MLGAALHKPPAGFADIPISRRSRSGPLWAAPVLPLMVPSSRRTVPGNDAFHGAKSRRQGPVPLLREVAHRHRPGETFHRPARVRQHPAKVREAAMSIWPGTHSPRDRDGNANRGIFPRASSRLVRESLHPLRRGLGPAAPAKVIGAQHHDQQVGVRRNVRCRVGSSRPLAPQLPQHPSGFGRQDVHPSAARGTAPAQPGPGIVAPGAGIGETDDLPHSCPSKAQAPDVPSPSPHPV